MAHLLQFGESEWVAVLGSELHESHVGRVSELSDDAETGEQPDKRGRKGEKDVSEEMKCLVLWQW